MLIPFQTDVLRANNTSLKDDVGWGEADEGGGGDGTGGYRGG